MVYAETFRSAECLVKIPYNNLEAVVKLFFGKEELSSAVPAMDLGRSTLFERKKTAWTRGTVVSADRTATRNGMPQAAAFMLPSAGVKRAADCR